MTLREIRTAISDMEDKRDSDWQSAVGLQHLITDAQKNAVAVARQADHMNADAAAAVAAARQRVRQAQDVVAADNTELDRLNGLLSQAQAQAVQDAGAHEALA